MLFLSFLCIDDYVVFSPSSRLHSCTIFQRLIVPSCNCVHFLLIRAAGLRELIENVAVFGLCVVYGVVLFFAVPLIERHIPYFNYIAPATNLYLTQTIVPHGIRAIAYCIRAIVFFIGAIIYGIGYFTGPIVYRIGYCIRAIYDKVSEQFGGGRDTAAADGSTQNLINNPSE